MVEQPVTYEVVAGVARIELNRPAAANTITMPLAVALREAAERAGADPEVRAVLPRAIGQQRALTFALRNAPVGASTALEWGMVTEVADDAVTTAAACAEQFAGGPAYALGQARRLLRAGWSVERAASGADEAATIAAAVVGEEGQRLVAAFLAR